MPQASDDWSLSLKGLASIVLSRTEPRPFPITSLRPHVRCNLLFVDTVCSFPITSLRPHLRCNLLFVDNVCYEIKDLLTVLS